MMVPPGRRRPARSAASIIGSADAVLDRPARVEHLELGEEQRLAVPSGPRSRVRREIRTSGVLPTRSRIEYAYSIAGGYRRVRSGPVRARREGRGGGRRGGEGLGLTRGCVGAQRAPPNHRGPPDGSTAHPLCQSDHQKAHLWAGSPAESPSAPSGGPFNAGTGPLSHSTRSHPTTDRRRPAADSHRRRQAQMRGGHNSERRRSAEINGRCASGDVRACGDRASAPPTATPRRSRLPSPSGTPPRGGGPRPAPRGCLPAVPGRRARAPRA